MTFCHTKSTPVVLFNPPLGFPEGALEKTSVVSVGSSWPPMVRLLYWVPSVWSMMGISLDCA